MFATNVAHGHPASGGSTWTSHARATAPANPPAKIAANSRPSRRMARLTPRDRIHGLPQHSGGRAARPPAFGGGGQAPPPPTPAAAGSPPPPPPGPPGPPPPRGCAPPAPPP